MTQGNSVVAIFGSHAEADAAVKELQRSGFDMKKLSIVGRDYHSDEHVVGYYNAGDRMRYWGTMGAGIGAFWGGLWGLLFGAAFFWIPGLGPTLVAGPLVSMIVDALEAGILVGGLDAIGAGLYSLGIPKDSILKYETALKADKSSWSSTVPRLRRPAPATSSAVPARRQWNTISRKPLALNEVSRNVPRVTR
ncbi:MAG TPA: general stress protein [Pirellulales bacterium]|jgi:hypothetical protein|nr:general stress protein [Pirellulales bacterium]